MLLVALSAISFPTAQIDAVLNRATFKGALIGVYVQTLDGVELLDRHADFRLMPASNEKLLSVAYALWKLGPKYRPVTKFWKTDSGWFVDSPGDPSMTSDQLRSLRKRYGSGSKVFVRQAYRPGFGPGWEWDDLPNRYAPTVSAFTFDTASFELWGSPNKLWIKGGPDFGIKISRDAKAAGANRFDLASRQLVVVGPMPKSEGKIEAFALPNPDHLAASLLGGKFIAATGMPKSEPTVEVPGDSVAELAKNCLQPSDNFLAESLLMMAASAEGALPKDAYPEATKRLRAFLTGTVGLDPVDVDPYDGSGLSRHNNVSPKGLAKVLAWARKQPWADIWTQSLASPGVGTLKNRLKGSSFRGKTGTLNKASCLSGYCKTNAGEELIVSLMFNHYLGGDAVARDAQDEIIKILEANQTDGPILAPAYLDAFALPHPSHRVADVHWVR